MLPKIKVHIRWMIRRDMPEVMDIERQSFEFPWFEEEFIRCLRQRNCMGMVAEHAERVVGFMIYELHRDRLHLLNLAVAADERGRGVGKSMIDKLAWKLSDQRRTRITLEVRESNLEAQLFFKACGLNCTDIIENFFDHSDEPAYRFVYRIQQREGALCES